MQKQNTLLKGVILAGGEGTRLRPLTYNIPKPMMPVLNRPFLEHILTHLGRCRIKDIILALGYLSEVTQSYFGEGSALGIKLTYAVENTPLGTAGAVKNAQRYLDSTFAVFNGDIFTDLDVGDMLAFHRARGAKVTIALTWVENPCAFGVVETDSDGRVRRFTEKPSPDRVTTHWINAGIYILEPEVLEHVPAQAHYTFESELFPLLLKLGEPVYGYPVSGYWLDMGTLEKYLQLNCDLLLCKAKSALLNNIGDNAMLLDEQCTVHPSAQLLGPAILGSRSQIGHGSLITGPAVIGSGCYIGENARIERVVLWSDVSVGAGVTLKQCVVGSDTAITDNTQVTGCTIVGDQKVML